MGTGDAACHSNPADDLSLYYYIIFCHIDVIHMAIHGDQSLTVVNKNGVSVEKIVPGGHHDTGGGGPDGGPR